MPLLAIFVWVLPVWVRVVLGAEPARPDDSTTSGLGAVADRSNLFPPSPRAPEHVRFLLCGGVRSSPPPPNVMPENAVFAVARKLRLQGDAHGALRVLGENYDVSPRIARTWRRAAIEETALVLDRDGRREADAFVDEIARWRRDRAARSVARELHLAIARAEVLRVMRWTVPPSAIFLGCMVWLLRERRRRVRDIGRIQREMDATRHRLGPYR